MTEAIQLVVGLGNPGPEYSNTRHNAGQWFVEQLARRFNTSLKAEAKFYGLTGKFLFEGREIKLLVPTTYMNLSGKAVLAMAQFYKIPPQAILISHDEMALEPGIAKLKLGGGHAGHNGLKDIQATLGNTEYARLRFGVGNEFSKGSQADYVLGTWTNEEAKALGEKMKKSILSVLSA